MPLRVPGLYIRATNQDQPKNPGDPANRPGQTGHTSWRENHTNRFPTANWFAAAIQVRNRRSRNRYSRQLARSEEHTSELQSPDHLVCRLLLEKKKTTQ